LISTVPVPWLRISSTRLRTSVRSASSLAAAVAATVVAMPPPSYR
jgi:hypothetical protein